ncbi:MAG: tRNA (adenosine(37)-N6)-threonylcarbamoyltransferase complex dimerization subunit type 1 TsaB [Gemmatimonadota bacterium]
MTGYALALDTATDRLSAALGAPGEEVLERLVSGARRHAAEVAPVVEGLLAEAGVELGDVGEILISDGPGSFTGLRVAAAFVKALARVRNLPVYRASTLMVRAVGALQQGRVTVGSLSSALRGEVYRAAYGRSDAGGVVELAAPRTALISAAWSGEDPTAMVGDLPDESLAQAPWWGRVPYEGPPLGLPRAASLLWLRQVGAAQKIEDVAGWEPNYGRPAEAQVRWEAAHGRSLSDSAGYRR